MSALKLDKIVAKQIKTQIWATGPYMTDVRVESEPLGWSAHKLYPSIRFAAGYSENQMSQKSFVTSWVGWYFWIQSLILFNAINIYKTTD